MSGEQYYAGFRRGDDEFRVGQVVRIHSGSAGLRKYRNRCFVAEIECMWEDVYKKKWMECRW